MKKLILSALCVMLMAGASVTAQDVAKADSARTTIVEKIKTEVKIADLPQQVKATLAGPQFAGWTSAETAIEVKDAAGSADFYKINLKKTSTGETKTVEISADGKVKE